MNRIEQHNRQVLAGLFKLKKPLLRWRGIVIHHTASEYSSLKSIDRYHRKKFNDPLGIEYHFLIGNGKKAPAGWIEPARWLHQARAIHLFKPDNAPHSIAVSLVGNFEKRRIGRHQLRAVIQLTQALIDGCKIPLKHITTHRRVDGRLTQCPGKLFPYQRFLKSLRAPR